MIKINIGAEASRLCSFCSPDETHLARVAFVGGSSLLAISPVIIYNKHAGPRSGKHNEYE